MAPRKLRRGQGRLVKDSVTAPPTATDTMNTHGFAALADEIYLEILSYIRSVPIPTSVESKSYPKIRRSRHETLLSLSQTSRSLRRFFWRYLWQRIEVREGMRIRGEDNSLRSSSYLRDHKDVTGHKNYARELVRQLEIVTIRNPQLAQYVNYVDIFIGEYSLKTVLAELARCLTLFTNLHTVQIDVVSDLGAQRRSLSKIFERTFRTFSYPQIRNVFVMTLSASFIVCCPQTRRISFKPPWSMSRFLQTVIYSCPHLEVFDYPELMWSPKDCKRVVDNFPNLLTIQVKITLLHLIYFPYMDVFKNLNHLQTIIIGLGRPMWHPLATRIEIERAKEDWIESLKDILLQIQLRDNLEKTLVVQEYDSKDERRILLKPSASIGLEEGSF